MPNKNKTELELNLPNSSDVTDSPLAIPFATDIVATALDTLTGKVVSQTKTRITQYAETKAKKMGWKLFRWIKWNVIPRSDEEISSKASSYLLTDLFYIIKKAFQKHVAENKQEEYSNIFENLWAKNFRKIALEAFKEEEEQADLKEKIFEINKFLNQNLKSKNKSNVVVASRVTKDKLLKDIIKILKTLKTNKKAQEIVKEWKELKKITTNDFLKVQTPYYWLHRDKKTKLENKIVNLNLDELIFADKVTKLVDIFKKDEKITQFLTENLNVSVHSRENIKEEIKKEIEEKTEKWKKRVNAESSFLQFNVSESDQNLASNNSENSEIEQTDFELLNEQQQKEQKEAYRERLKEIKQEERRREKENKHFLGNSIFIG